MIRELKLSTEKRVAARGDTSKQKPLALFTESMITLLSGSTTHTALIDLVSLMAQSFPLAAPAIYTRIHGQRKKAYAVTEHRDGGYRDARRVLGSDDYEHVSIHIGGHPPEVRNRVDLTLFDGFQARVVLSINSGLHVELFQEWVKYLTPAVAKLVDNELLLHMAFRDGLTGLLNYRAFQEILEAEWQRCQRYGTTFSLMMIDIDYFKRVNDVYGHPAGDSVLKALALRLQARLRKSDLVFRYGGEEFMVLLPQTGIYRARMLAERLRLMVERMRFVHDVQATVSIGVSQYREGLSCAELVRQVDRGLYLAKEWGRNRVELFKEIS
ncbi:MAG TPA: GGDEF domain-containing protein [Deltaproteobacteria bacterium]|nr:GGDEF domain-containing protein [Deltaproteobacteria bacterium]